MSDAYNQKFVTDPIAFINQYTVNIFQWFSDQQGKKSDDNDMLIQTAERSKFCNVDLDPVVFRAGARPDSVIFKFKRSAPIAAYWVPYHSNSGLPGFADVERTNPISPFVFTAGMNGCALVVTGSPLGGGYMRVYHHPHPDPKNGQITRTNEDGIDYIVDVSDTTSDSNWNSINGVGQPTLAFFGFDDYRGKGLASHRSPVAFNFLFYRNGVWNFVSQPQMITSGGFKLPPYRLIDQVVERPVF